MNAGDALFDLSRWFITYGEVLYQTDIHFFGISGSLLFGADTKDSEFAQIYMMTIEYEERDGLTYGNGTGYEGRFGDVRRLGSIAHEFISLYYRIVLDMTDYAVFSNSEQGKINEIGH